MQFFVLRALQLATEIYANTFFADMIAFYLLFQLITHLSLSATNLVICHADKLYKMLIIMTASAESAAQVNRITIMTNSVLMITVIMFVNEYAGPADYMSFDEREEKNEKKRKITKLFHVILFGYRE